MFFIIKNNRYLSAKQLQTDTLLDAYYIIKKYPFHATEIRLEQFIKQQYKTTLKNICIKLLLNMTFQKTNTGDFVLLFKNPKYDQIARLITYGNGVVPGSQILQIALKQ